MKVYRFIFRGSRSARTRASPRRGAGLFGAWWIFGLLVAGALLSSRANAAPLEFNLPAATADAALLAFSKQAKIEILFSHAELRRVRSTAVVGAYEPEAALKLLLEGTGFTAQRNLSGKFIVAPVPPAPGAVQGKILAPDGRPVRGLRISLRGVSQAAVTDEQGEFRFFAVPPGAYRVVATGAGYPATLIADDARVKSSGLLTLPTHTLRTGGDPTRLSPVVVEGRSDRGRRFPEDELSSGSPVAAGNLDLPRTRDDALPYTVFGREQIVRSGVVNLNDFLQRNLLDSDAITRPPEQRPDGDESGESFSAGSTNLRLRGFGADETIVLVNGRRLPAALVAGPYAARQPQTPDVNFVPLSLVDRVEVLPVSASALYSGNAVGGVINIVLRPDFEATELTSTYTNALGGFDAPQSVVSLQHGRTLLGGALRLRFNATFTRTEPPTEAELGYIRTHLARRPASGERLHRATPNLRSGDGSPLFGAGTADVTSVAPGADGRGGYTAFAGREGLRSTALFDSPGGMGNSPESSDFPYGRRQRGYSYFGSANYDVQPWLQIGVDGITTQTVLNRGAMIFPGDLMLDAGSPFNPFDRPVEISLNETAPRLGENYNEARVGFSAVVAGLLFKLPRDWQVMADAQYGHNVTRYRGLVGVNAARWQGLVDTAAYNPLRDTQVYGPPPEFYDRVLKYYGSPGRFVTLGNYETLDAAVRISNRSLSLPTGSGALNLGADYRQSHLRAFTNEQRYGDGTLVETPGQWSARTLERVSVFGELQTPLLPARWLPRAVRGTELDIAARYVAAATAQETNVAPTGGLKIDLAGGFALRATFAMSNRFPPPVLSRKVAAPVNTGAGSGEVSLELIVDPARSERYGVLSSEELNADLRPEAAVSRTVGVLFQRGKINRVRLAVDFIDTRKSGELRELGAQGVVDLESLFPGRVKRAPSSPSTPNRPGLINSVLTGNINLAWRHSQNWSASADHVWTQCAGGRLETYAKWIIFKRYAVQLLPNSPVVDELGAPESADSGLMRHRVNFGAGWSNPHFGFGIDGHYFHSRVLPASDWAAQGSDRIAPHWQFDPFVQGDLGRWLPWKSSRFGLRGQLRLNNVFNSPPPGYANAPTNTGVQSYGDWRGRVYSVSVTATF